jgi:hypothetical protein
MRTDLKRLVVSTAVFCLVSIGMGQVTPEAFMGTMPELTGSPCGMKDKQLNDYLTKVSEISQQIDDEISRRDQEAEANAEGAEDQMKTRMGKEAGLSDADIGKLKNMDNLSEAEQAALVDEMLDGKYNLSLSEIEKLKKMSAKGQEAWAQAYAKEALANAQANPAQVSSDQVKARSLYEVTKELKGLLDRIGAQESKYAQQFSDLDQDSEAKAIRELEAKLRGMSSGGEVTEAKRKEMEALSKKIQAARKAYCPRYSSRYQGILEHHGDAIKSMLADYNRIDEIQFELISMEAGVKKGRAQTGLTGLKAVQRHAGLLNGIFKYCQSGD